MTIGRCESVRNLFIAAVGLLFFGGSVICGSALAVEYSFSKDIKPFLGKYCVNCHGEKKQKAKFTVHDLTEGKLVHWEKILEEVVLDYMPPEEEPQPSRKEREKFVAWVTGHLRKNGVLGEREPVPAVANRVSHEDLFSGENTGPAFTYSRTWRMSHHIYEKIHSRSKAGAGIPALPELSGEGFRDYALLRADDAAVRGMMQNYRKAAQMMTVGWYDAGKGEWDTRNALRLELFNESKPGAEIRPEAYDNAVKNVFKIIMDRAPTEEELGRYRAFLVSSVAKSDPRRGAQSMIMALMLSPEFIFRMELGLGEELAGGRRLLSPDELAFSIAYTLGDEGPDDELKKAIAEGRLATAEDVAREARRLLFREDNRDGWGYGRYTWFTDWRHKYNPRLLRFFQEFFNYTNAEFVFKDEKLNPRHSPQYLIRDADYLVLDAIDRNKDVLETLLTSDKYIVAHTPPSQRESRLEKEKAELAKSPKLVKPSADALRNGRTPILAHYDLHGALVTFGLDPFTWDYPTEQPFKQPVPRVGMLTHPAWLIAWSGNFDNKTIQRGKWIREHLLAGVVPELPIGVPAQLSSDPHKTVREKMEITRAEECWRCHRLMDDLGLAFEAYDHFGRYRDGTIVLGDQMAHAGKLVNHLNKQSHLYYKRVEADMAGAPNAAELIKEYVELKPPAPEHSAPVDASGVLKGTGDPELDGPYKDAHELMHRLAKSERVRQSFIRHVFRYFMGRNEMLSDSPTLMAMDKTYVESGGSFKEAIITLMTSDSFLTRKFEN